MPRRAKPKIDNSLLEMALAGYQAEMARLSAKIADIRARLGHRGPGRPPKAAAVTGPAESAPKKRTMSKAGRARIAAAQKARWAAYNKSKRTQANA
jgi:hypothetical protein